MVISQSLKLNLLNISHARGMNHELPTSRLRALHFIHPATWFENLQYRIRIQLEVWKVFYINCYDYNILNFLQVHDENYVAQLY